MHPTPAVGGEPLRGAAPLIPALEGLDRGWYSGPVGWTDAAGDGEFCVALRCALLRGDVARCYAGNGIVRDSDPAARARRDGDQAAGAAAAAGGLSALRGADQSRAERARARAALDVARCGSRSVRTSTMLEPLGGERALERGAERATSLDALVREAVERRGVGEVEPGRRRDVARVDVLAIRRLRRAGASARSRTTGRKSKMPPPPLSSRTIVSFKLQAPGGEQAADVVRERDVADQQHHRAPAPRGGRAERRGDGAVDAVGAAVAEHARRVRADRPEGLDVAHRHRGGDEQRRLRAAAARRARRRPPARDSCSPPSTPRIASAARSSALRQLASQSSLGAAGARCRRARRQRSARGSARARASRTAPTPGPARRPRGRARPAHVAEARRATCAAALRPAGRRRAARGRAASTRRSARRAAARRSARSPRRRGARPTAGRPAAASRRPRELRARPRPSGRATRSSRPATTTPRCAPPPRARCSSRVGAARRGAPRSARARTARPSARAAAVVAAAARRVTSGSRSGKFRCTAPGPALERRPVGAAGERAHPAQPLPALASCVPTSKNHFAAPPYSFSWSIACPAPFSRSSGGRSAVSSSSGTRASCASIAAGSSSAAAVPGRARDGHRQPRGLRQPEREEPRAALVDVREAAQPRLARERQHERRPARAGRGARRAHAAAHELVDERSQQHVGVGGRGHRMGAVPESVVLLHGFSGTRRAWDGVVARLDRERYRPLALDLPGHGEARATRSARSRSPAACSRARAAPERFALCGYSLGGRVALHVALAAPERVARLVLVSTQRRHRGRRRARRAPRAPTTRSPTSSKRIRSSISSSAGARSRCSPTSRPRWRALAREDQRRNRPAALAAALRGIGTGEMQPLWERLGELKMPVTVLAGERDAKFRALGRADGRAAAGRAAAVVRGGPRAGAGEPAAVASRSRRVR